MAAAGRLLGTSPERESTGLTSTDAPGQGSTWDLERASQSRVGSAPWTQGLSCVETLPLTAQAHIFTSCRACGLHQAEPRGPSGSSPSANPSTHWCCPLHASLPPAWMHAVASSLPTSILCPPWAVLQMGAKGIHVKPNLRASLPYSQLSMAPCYLRTKSGFHLPLRPLWACSVPYLL